MKEQVDKLVALGPNVVLVEKSVARKAQDELLERGISLALNMKRPVLDFIARCTGAEVASHRLGQYMEPAVTVRGMEGHRHQPQRAGGPL